MAPTPIYIINRDMEPEIKVTYLGSKNNQKDVTHGLGTKKREMDLGETKV